MRGPEKVTREEGREIHCGTIGVGSNPHQTDPKLVMEGHPPTLGRVDKGNCWNKSRAVSSCFVPECSLPTNPVSSLCLNMSRVPSVPGSEEAELRDCPVSVST